MEIMEMSYIALIGDKFAHYALRASRFSWCATYYTKVRDLISP